VDLVVGTRVRRSSCDCFCCFSCGVEKKMGQIVHRSRPPLLSASFSFGGKSRQRTIGAAKAVKMRQTTSSWRKRSFRLNAHLVSPLSTQSDSEEALPRCKMSPTAPAPTASDLRLDSAALQQATTAQRGEVFLLQWLSACEKAVKELPEVRLSPLLAAVEDEERKGP
jgi:hypothetical protein